jgi:hypothetical protein
VSRIPTDVLAAVVTVAFGDHLAVFAIDLDALGNDANRDAADVVLPDDFVFFTPRFILFSAFGIGGTGSSSSSGS